MSELWEVAVYLGHFFWYLAPGIIAIVIFVALACYGIQMIRLFFKFSELSKRIKQIDS